MEILFTRATYPLQQSSLIASSRVAEKVSDSADEDTVAYTAEESQVEGPDADDYNKVDNQQRHLG